MEEKDDLVEDEIESDEQNGDGPKGAGGKTRSGTPYPYYGLAVAIDIVEAIRRAGGSEAPNLEVMREMGIKKAAERQWGYGIPAAVLFGLVERIGRGNTGRLKLTDLANRIVLPVSDEEKAAAKVAAFKTPELYATLLQRYAGHGVPQKDSLKNLLHRDFKIVESMAPIAAEAFLDSLKDAGLTTADNRVIGATGKASEATKPKDAVEPPKPLTPGTQTMEVPEDYIVYKCKIGPKRVLDIALPPNFSSPELKRLYAFLKTQIDDPEALEGQGSQDD